MTERKVLYPVPQYLVNLRDQPCNRPGTLTPEYLIEIKKQYRSLLAFRRLQRHHALTYQVDTRMSPGGNMALRVRICVRKVIQNRQKLIKTGNDAKS